MFEGGPENYYKMHALGFSSLCKFGLKWLQRHIVLSPEKKNNTKPTRPVKKIIGRAPQKQKKKRQLVAHRSGARQRPMQSWHLYIVKCSVYINNIYIYIYQYT